MIFNFCSWPFSPGGPGEKGRTVIFRRKSQILGRLQPKPGDFLILIWDLSTAKFRF
jgi:hypothetical protein